MSEPCILQCIPPMGEPMDHKAIFTIDTPAGYRDAMVALVGNDIGQRLLGHLMWFGVLVPTAPGAAMVARLCEHIRVTAEGDPERVEEAIRVIRLRLAVLVPGAPEPMPVERVGRSPVDSAGNPGHS